MYSCDALPMTIASSPIANKPIWLFIGANLRISVCIVDVCGFLHILICLFQICFVVGGVGADTGVDDVVCHGGLVFVGWIYL